MSAAWIVVIVCLWLVVVGLAVVVAGVLRRVATVLEAQAAIGQASGRRVGPVNGARLPEIAVGGASGRAVLLSALPGPFVLAVLTSHCSPCLAIAETLRTSPERLRGAGRLVVLTDVDGRAVIDLDHCATVLTDADAAAIRALDVPGTPFAITVDAQGSVASASLLGGADQLLGMLGVPESDLTGGLQIRFVG
ncbi:MAG: TlpA family protein disulfide reductase [Solirubrobacteraceae bacterium]